MKNKFEQIIENNHIFLSLLENLIEKSKEETSKLNIYDTKFNYFNGSQYINDRLNELNKTETFKSIKLLKKDTNKQRRIEEYYFNIKQEDGNEYLIHFHVHKQKIELSAIGHQFFAYAKGGFSSKFTYSKKYTSFDSSKNKEAIRIEGKNVKNNIEDLNDMYKLTKDIDFLEELKLSIKIIGNDKEKENFINAFYSFNDLKNLENLKNRRKKI